VAANKMVDGYMYDRPNSVRILNQKGIRGKLDIVPDIDAIQILKRAKPMDIMTAGTVGGGGILLSDKLLKTIMAHTLPVETQIFDAYAIHKDKHYHYNYFYIFKSQEKRCVDWSKSRFKERNFTNLIGEEFVINIDNVNEQIAKGIGVKSTRPTRLVFKTKEINVDILKLDFSFRGYYVSETLKKAIEEAGCEGVDLIPIDQLGFEVEFV